MKTISLNILQVVEAIDAARDKTKRGEDDECRHQIIQLQQVIAEENRRKDKSVLEPLQRAKELDIVYHRAAKVAQISRITKLHQRNFR